METDKRECLKRGDMISSAGKPWSPFYAERRMEYYKPLITSDQITRRVQELALEISENHSGSNPLFITLLKGAFIFLADLVRNLTIDHEIDFITISSYRNGSKRCDALEVTNHIRADLKGRDIIIIDEIVDSGFTLSQLISTLNEQRTGRISVCTLLDKPSARKTSVPLDYVGFEIPDVFVVGYGLDYMEQFRNLPFIAELTPELRRYTGIEHKSGMDNK